MAKVRFGGGGAVLFVCMLVFFCLTVTNSVGDKEGQSNKKESLWEWHRLRDAYSMYSALFTTSVGQYWGSFKALVNQAYVYFFPPNIDFRRGGDEGQGVTDNGAGEKVKEAMAKSIGTSKATVEDAAKSAADIAGETVHKAKEKVKRTLSGDDKFKQPQNEL